MPIDFILERFRENHDRDAMVWRNRVFDYGWLLARIDYWKPQLDARDFAPQSVVLLEGDYSPNTIALMLELIRRQCVVVPLTGQSRVRREESAEVVGAAHLIDVGEEEEVRFERLRYTAVHSLYENLRRDGHPGLVLFSSGTTGIRKAALHDFARLLQKYTLRRRDLRTLTFLLYDHIGGVDTLFYSLSHASCIVTVADRLPDTVCAAIEAHAVEVLPVSPSFLNLLILSEAYKRYDFSSLKVITYGAEVMPEATLRRCHEIFPGVEFLQKFGTTEVGTLRSKSKSADSTWVKIGGEGYDVRVVDGILQIKAQSAMLGYLNAPDPFTQDGWFITGDLAEVDGEYIRILGRESDVINVGGEKVHPAEVENVIHELGIAGEVAVYGEANAILGHILCAGVKLLNVPSDQAVQRSIVKEIKAHCRRRLEPHKVPLRITIVEGALHTERFKKVRHGA
jgi:acyl-coenzyme A synthetase/AMP-(fatty) acid ligase